MEFINNSRDIWQKFLEFPKIPGFFQRRALKRALKCAFLHRDHHMKLRNGEDPFSHLTSDFAKSKNVSQCHLIFLDGPNYVIEQINMISNYIFFALLTSFLFKHVQRLMVIRNTSIGNCSLGFGRLMQKRTCLFRKLSNSM